MKLLLKCNIVLPVIVTGLILYIGFSGCSGNVDVKAPYALKESIDINIPTSTFNLPVSYSIKDLQGFLNQKIQGDFLSTIIHPLKNDKDQVKLELEKFSDIQLKSSNNELLLVFPLKVKAAFIKSRLNIISKEVKPVETVVEIELSTVVSLDSNWHLVTNFKLVNIHWLKKPMLRLVGRNFDLTQKIESYLRENKTQLTDLLDKEINKGVSLEQPVAKIWNDLQQPIIISKKPPKAYIRFVCRNISGDFVLGTEDIVCHTSINADVVLITDTVTGLSIPKLPAFKENNSVVSNSDVCLYAFSTFDEINAELSRRIAGKRLYAEGFYITLDSLNAYASDSGLTLRVITSGDINGEFIGTGLPVFNSLKQTFQLQNFQFQLGSSNILLNAGHALLHNVIKDTVQALLSVGMDSLIGKVPGIIKQAIAKGKTGRSIDVDIDNLKVLSCQIKMGAKRIHFLIHTDFVAGINIKKIRPGKQIFIKPKKKKRVVKN